MRKFLVIFGMVVWAALSITFFLVFGGVFGLQMEEFSFSVPDVNVFYLIGSFLLMCLSFASLIMWGIKFRELA